MVDFTRVTKPLPSWLLTRLKQSPIKTVFDRVRLRFGDFDDVVVNCECGPFKLVLPKNTHFFKQIEESETGHEPELTERLSSILTPTDVFYDIGAAYGYFSKLAIQCGVFPSNVHTFEVDWYRNQLLQQNLPESTVNIVSEFVGLPSDPDSLSIDEYYSEADDPTVVKIDVEGAEVNVLAGMNNTIHDVHPRLFIECHPELVDGGVQSLEKLI